MDDFSIDSLMENWDKLNQFEKIQKRYQWKNIYFDIIKKFDKNKMTVENAMKIIEKEFDL